VPARCRPIDALFLSSASLRSGNFEGGLIACVICHGADGQGVTEIGVPRIAGQSPAYLQGILTTFAQVPDFGEPVPNAMHIVASALTPEDMSAVIAYLASRPWGDQ
jgi:cytochrome c553